MASSASSTSASQQEMIEKKSQQETMRLLRRVLQKCDEERRLGCTKIPINNFMNRAAYYSGLHPDVLAKLNNDKEVVLELKEVDRSVVHNAIINFYLSGKMPTTMELFNELQGEIPPYVDIRSFRKMLVKMSYIWKKIDKYGMVVMEKPTATFEKYHYLKKIMEIRKEERPIVFVDEFIADRKGNVMSLNDNLEYAKRVEKEYVKFLKIAISNIKVIDAEFSDTFGEETFSDWVKNTLVFSLPSQSMVVLNRTEHNSKQIIAPPTAESLKIDLIEWLEHHNVPCNVNMSKHELFSLAEEYTNLVETYKIDQILNFHGHEVLRLPNTIKRLTPTIFVSELMKKNYENERLVTNGKDQFDTFQNIISRITPDLLMDYDNFVAIEEKNLMEAEMKIDKKLEQLISDMSNCIAAESDEDSDVPTFSDSD